MMYNFEKYYKDLEKRKGKAKENLYNLLPKDIIDIPPHISK